MERAKETLIRLLTSAKIWVAVSGLIATFAARRGIVLSPEDLATIKDVTMVVIGAIGAQDLGKAVAAMKSAPPSRAFCALRPSELPSPPPVGHTASEMRCGDVLASER